MKILNQTKSMYAIKYFLLIVLSCLTLIINAQTPTIVANSYSCGKLNMSWIISGTATNYTYEVQIFKNGTSIGTPISIPRGVLNCTFPSASNEVLESGINYSFKVKSVLYASPYTQSAWTSNSPTQSTNYSALAPSVTSISCTGFTVNWTPLMSNCSAIMYKLNIYQCTSSGTIISNVTPNSLSMGTILTPFVFTDVIPGSYYKVEVSAKANNGTITTYVGNATSSVIQIPSTISNVTGLTLTTSNTGSPANNNCNTLNASWDRNPCATEYEVKLYLSNLPSPTLIGTYTVPNPTSGNVNYSFTNLTPTYAYRYTVRALYKYNGTELYTSGTVIGSYTNLPAAIATPTNFRLVSKCGRAISIAWTSSTDPRASGYLLDISTDYNFTSGNFVWDGNLNNYYQDYNIAGAGTSSITINLPSFAPFGARTLYFRLRTKNINNTCNSAYTNPLQVWAKEDVASLGGPDYAYFSQVETPNNFLTYYWSLARPHRIGFSADACVTQCQLKVEMANADGTLFTPTSTGTSNVRWTGPVVGGANVATFLYGPPVLSQYIIDNGGTVSNYNGIGTSNNLNNSSFILAPETKYGTQVLSTGYHKITSLYWVGLTQYSQSIIVKVINSLADFKLQYPKTGTEPFTDYYFNTSNSQYQFGPGFQCLDFGSTINAKSSLPNVVVDPPFSGSTWDDIYTPFTKIIFSKAATASEFYLNASNVSQILGTKTLTTAEMVSLRNGTLNLINLFNSLNVTGDIGFIGIYSGAGYGSNPLISTTKIIEFGYVAKPTNVALTYKCGSDINLSWTGNSGALGTNYYVTMGTSYNPNNNTISNFVNTKDALASSYTLCNNKLVSNMATSLTTNILNSTNGTVIYVQVKAQNLGKICTSDPSIIYSFTINGSPFRSTSAVGSWPNNTIPICFGNPITVTNLSYDPDCISQLKLVVRDALNNNILYSASPESASSFINHLNNLNTNVPIGEQYPVSSVQNYINYTRGISPTNPLYTGYNGNAHLNSNGYLFKPAFVNSFNQHNFNIPGAYRIDIQGLDGSGNLFTTWTNYYIINSPNNYILLKKDDDSYTSNDYYTVPTEKGYDLKTLTTYLNKKYISITANTGNSNNVPTNCLGAVYIDFANSVSSFSTTFNSPLSGTNLSNFLSGGLDINAYATNLGKLYNTFIRFTYMTNPGSNKYVSAIYGFSAQPTSALYVKANIAYETEKLLGFRDIVLEANPSKVYIYDHNNHFYISGNDILIPDNNSTEVSNTNFFGFTGGIPSSTNFQWDNQTLDFSNRGSDYTFGWDETNLFVSPFSANTMNICDVIDQGNIGNPCNNTTVINIPAVVYTTNYYSTGNYVSVGSYIINNIIMDQGLVDNGSDNEFIIQQSASNNSYCVKKYGYGWRLPTATEIGKEDDLPVMIFNSNPAYFENSTGNIWTSNLWNNNNSWWEANGSNTNTQISLNNTFYSTNNYVRCVYKTN